LRVSATLRAYLNGEKSPHKQAFLGIGKSEHFQYLLYYSE
jgi:hypothetical protein